MEKNKKVLINFNIARYIKLCLKYWYIFVVSVVLFAAFFGAIALIKGKNSVVMAQLMLKEDVGGASSMFMAGQIARSFSIGDMFGGSSTTDNESFVIASHSVFLNTAKQLNLATSYSEKKFGFKWVPTPLKSPVRLIAPQEMSDTLRTAIEFRVNRKSDGKVDVKVKAQKNTLVSVSDQALPVLINTSYGSFTIDKTEFFDTDESDSYKIVICSYDAAAEVYQKLVKVYVPDRKTDFIDLQFVTPDPVFGKSLLKAIIDNYMSISNIYNYDRSSQSLRLVDERLASLSSDLLNSETAVEKFKIANNLTDVEVDAKYLVEKTGALEASLLTAQTNLEVIKLTKDFLQNPNNKYSLLPEFLVSNTAIETNASSDQTPSQLAHYNSLILRRMSMLNTSKPDNIQVKQLEDQIDVIRDNIVASVDRQYKNASVLLSDLKAEDQKTKSRIGSLPSVERQYLILKRDNMLQEQIYLFLLQQREEINMSIASKTFPAQVIDPPYVMSDPPGISKIMILAIGVLLGLISAAAYIFFVVMKRSPISSKSEIDSVAKVPMLETLGTDSNVGRVLSVAGVSENSEAFRRLRSDVQFALADCGGNAVAVTSLHAGEGRTYVAVNLAAALALTGRRVALVDASLRSPAVANALGIKAAPALGSFVRADAATIDPTVVEVDGRPLYVITSAPTTDNAADIVASPKFAQLIADLKKQYDYVVVDASQIEGYSDIFYVTDVVDMTLVVCRAKSNSINDLKMLNDLYDEGKLKRMAVVKNGFK